MVREYRYGDAWERYPIGEGEIWSAGPNRFLCSDIKDVSRETLQRLISNDIIDIVYTDAPYNQAALSAYRTKAGIVKKEKMAAFMHNLIFLSRASFCKMAYIEIGWNDYAALSAEIRANGGNIWSIDDITYYNLKPCKIVRFSFQRLDTVRQLNGVDLSGMDDGDTPYKVMELEQPATVLDLCIGMGLTARASFKYGVICYGIELNKRRLANVLDFYSKQGLEVIREGNING